MPEWPTVKLESLASPDRHSFAIGPFGSKVTTSDYRQAGIPFIRGVNLARGIFFDEGFVFISDEKSNEIESALVRPGDLIFTRKGTVGQVSMIPRSPQFDKYAISGSQVKARLDPSSAYAEFYYYWFSSPFGRQSLLAHAVTTGVPSLANSLFTVRNLSVPHPPVHEQRAIAAALGALDSKIAINNRITAISESFLRSLFNLYSTESKTVRIDEVGSPVRHLVKPGELLNGEPYIGLEHIPRRNIWLTSWGESTEVDSTKNAFQKGDILFGRLRPYFHKVGLAQVDGICSTDIIVVRAKQHMHQPWLLMALSSDETIAYATARSDGTRMPRAKWADLAGFEIPWPHADVVARFENEATPLVKRVERSSAESRTLAALRDTLLPQLMSGRLRVRDAERTVEDAL